jgi:UDP-N-acetyl-D-glucosamine dehydrogenase
MNEIANSLLKKIKSHEALVGILGLGYVGLPLALCFTENGFNVLGFDVDLEKVEMLNRGESYIKHLDANRLKKATGNLEFDDNQRIQKTDAETNKSTGAMDCDDNSSFIIHNSSLNQDDKGSSSTEALFSATTDFNRLVECDAILICVPTPLGKHKEPDLSYVENSTKSIRKTLRTGQLIILESTTYPGTTDELLRGILESPRDDSEDEKPDSTRAMKCDVNAMECDAIHNSSFIIHNSTCGQDFFLAFSPEREDPGNPDFGTKNIPKVVGGVDEASGDLAEALYAQVLDSTVRVKNARTAEASKLVENIFRSVNIALVNELKMIFEKMDIDIWDVLDAAETKPFGFMRFNPGPGLGGHCIPLDPFYLAWKARESGQPTRFIELAGEINTQMPAYVIEKLTSALNEQGKPVKGSKILVLGLAYKPDIDDPRESPSFEIIELLLERGAEVSYHDPHIQETPRMRSWPSLPPMDSIPLSMEGLKSIDATIIVTDHRDVNYDFVLEHVPLIIDTRGVYRGENAKVESA